MCFGRAKSIYMLPRRAPSVPGQTSGFHAQPQPRRREQAVSPLFALARVSVHTTQAERELTASS